MTNGNNNIDYRMPLYIQIEDMILKRIDEGEYLPGSKIPSERDLAKQYGVNRMTIRRAIDELVEKGYLNRAHGKGTFVEKISEDKLDLGYLEGKNYYGTSALVEGAGGKAKNKLLGKEVVKNNRYLEYKLGLDGGEEIYAVRRVRYNNDIPLVIETFFVPKKFFSDIEDIDFANISLYDYMNSKGHVSEKFKQKMLVVNLKKKEAKYLELSEGKEVYYSEYIAKDKNGNIVEYTEEYANPEKTEIKFYYE